MPEREKKGVRRFVWGFMLLVGKIWEEEANSGVEKRERLRRAAAALLR